MSWPIVPVHSNFTGWALVIIAVIVLNIGVTCFLSNYQMFLLIFDGTCSIELIVSYLTGQNPGSSFQRRSGRPPHLFCVPRIMGAAILGLTSRMRRRCLLLTVYARHSDTMMTSASVCTFLCLKNKMIFQNVDSIFYECSENLSNFVAMYDFFLCTFVSLFVAAWFCDNNIIPCERHNSLERKICSKLYESTHFVIASSFKNITCERTIMRWSDRPATGCPCQWWVISRKSISAHT